VLSVGVHVVEAEQRKLVRRRLDLRVHLGAFLHQCFLCVLGPSLRKAELVAQLPHAELRHLIVVQCRRQRVLRFGIRR
jgi:hypothetical protein